jgi:hypothetical protein
VAFAVVPGPAQPAGVPLRQRVLTFPHAWRSRLAHDGALLGRLTRIFLQTVEAFYARRACERVAGTKASAKSGAVTVVQRTSSDMRVNPHLHSVFLDGAYRETLYGERELAFHRLAHLRTRDVGEVLERAVVRMLRHLTRRRTRAEVPRLQPVPEADEAESERRLIASAVSGHEPPAGPQWLRGLPPVRPAPLAYDKPCAPPSTASPCTPRPEPPASTHPAKRLCCATCSGRPSRRSASSTSPTAWCASPSSARSPTAPSPSRWIRSLCCAGSLQPYRRLATTS